MARLVYVDYACNNMLKNGTLIPNREPGNESFDRGVMSSAWAEENSASAFSAFFDARISLKTYLSASSMRTNSYGETYFNKNGGSELLLPIAVTLNAQHMAPALRAISEGRTPGPMEGFPLLVDVHAFTEARKKAAAADGTHVGEMWGMQDVSTIFLNLIMRSARLCGFNLEGRGSSVLQLSAAVRALTIVVHTAGVHYTTMNLCLDGEHTTIAGGRGAIVMTVHDNWHCRGDRDERSWSPGMRDIDSTAVKAVASLAGCVLAAKQAVLTQSESGMSQLDWERDANEIAAVTATQITPRLDTGSWQLQTSLSCPANAAAYALYTTASDIPARWPSPFADAAKAASGAVQELQTLVSRNGGGANCIDTAAGRLAASRLSLAGVEAMRVATDGAAHAAIRARIETMVGANSPREGAAGCAPAPASLSAATASSAPTLTAPIMLPTAPRQLAPPDAALQQAGAPAISATLTRSPPAPPSARTPPVPPPPAVHISPSAVVASQTPTQSAATPLRSSAWSGGVGPRHPGLPLGLGLARAGDSLNMTAARTRGSVSRSVDEVAPWQQTTEGAGAVASVATADAGATAVPAPRAPALLRVARLPPRSSSAAPSLAAPPQPPATRSRSGPAAGSAPSGCPAASAPPPEERRSSADPASGAARVASGARTPSRRSSAHGSGYASQGRGSQ